MFGALIGTRPSSSATQAATRQLMSPMEASVVSKADMVEIDCLLGAIEGLLTRHFCGGHQMRIKLGRRLRRKLVIELGRRIPVQWGHCVEDDEESPQVLVLWAKKW